MWRFSQSRLNGGKVKKIAYVKGEKEMRRFKNMVALLLAGTMCISLAACGGGESNKGGNGAASGGGTSDSSTITIATPSDPGNYKPFSADNSVRERIAQGFYESLFDDNLSEDNELVPVIAESYEELGGGLYHVKIKENVHDSQGNPITADDVVFCFQTTIDNGERTTTVGEMKSITKVDDYTVEMQFEGELVSSFSYSCQSVPIVSQKAFEASETGFSDDPIGTGPYVVEEWLPGSSMTLVKDDNYWNKDGDLDNQNIDKIVYKFISEPAQVAIEMETGSIDFAYNIDMKEIPRFQDNPAYTVIENPNQLTRNILFNCDESSIFSDERLRKAVCYAIDSEAIVQSVYNGMGGVPKVPQVKDYAIDYVDKWDEEETYTYDIDKAKELVEEAGYEGGPVRIMCKDQAMYRSTCEIIQSLLKEIGMEVEILAYENALYQTYRFQPETFDLCIAEVGIGTPYAPDGWKWYMLPQSNGKNVAFMQDDHMTELVNQACGKETHSEETVDALWQYMKETMPLFPYAYMNSNYVYVTDKISEVELVHNGLDFDPTKSKYN